MTFGSLFAGIGGMDLGLERAGMECRWQCELDPFARRVLTRHWPDIPKHDDVKTFPPGDDPDPWRVDLIAGGFPCQDLSYAGKGAGLAGERSGLWTEYARVIRELRPRYVLVENVSALLVRGLDSVLGTLASMGYDAEWGCISAASVGAPHRRDRVFVVAHAQGVGCGQGWAGGITPQGQMRFPSGQDVSHADGPRLEVGQVFGGDSREELAAVERGGITGGGQWEFEPNMGRMADGIPNRVDRIRTLGNAVVPQVAELVGRMILKGDS